MEYLQMYLSAYLKGRLAFSVILAHQPEGEQRIELIYSPKGRHHQCGVCV